jgi:hypothetical protein
MLFHDFFNEKSIEKNTIKRLEVKWVGKRLAYLTQPADQSWM